MKETQADFGLITGAPAVMELPPENAFKFPDCPRNCTPRCHTCAPERPLYVPLSYSQHVALDEGGRLDRSATQITALPTDPKARKATPVFSGVLKYFPDAIIAVARCSYIGNEQHNPGQPLHWAKGKSMDHEDCLLRHLLDDATGVPMDTDNIPHLAKVAWRALAALQTRIENERKAP